MKKNKNDNKTKKNINKNTENNNKLNTMNGGGNLNFCTYNAVSRISGTSKSDKSNKSNKSSKSSKSSKSTATRSSTGYSGIKNVGNTCFMNVAIQMLWSIPEIRKEILELDDKILSSKKKTPEIIIARYLHDIFNFFKQNKKTNKYYDNEKRLQTIRGFYRTFEDNKNTQEDSTEFLLKIIFKYFSLNNKFLNIEKYFKFNSTYKKKCLYNKDYKIKDITNQSYKLELNLHNTRQNNTIGLLIKYYCDEPVSDDPDDYFNECNDKNGNKKGPLKKNIVLDTFSDNLIINLVRNGFNKNTKKQFKLSDSIKPDNPLQIGSDSFQLKGCICHDGETNSGHYVYLVFDDKGKPIKYISDSRVYDIDPKNTDHLKRGYLYYYRKIKK